MEGTSSSNVAPATVDAELPVLSIEDLRVQFSTPRGTLKAVDGINLTLTGGEALGILGESGSGKSATAGAVMGVLDMPPAKVTNGRVQLGGQDLLTMSERQRRKVTGEKIAMVFQDALSALNPVHPVGRQIAELYRVHRGISRRESLKAAIQMMDQVHIPAASARVHDYPHQFSGGMRQRIMIAMALALDPDVLIADEPTTALDVTVQAQILELLKSQQRERGMAMILITHDLAVAAEATDNIAVMYAGKLVEAGSAQAVLANPGHPYTLGLARSVTDEGGRDARLSSIPGQPPDLLQLPPGCSFAPRCAFARDRCRTDEPPLMHIGPTRTAETDRKAACFYYEEVLSQ